MYVPRTVLLNHRFLETVCKSVYAQEWSEALVLLAGCQHGLLLGKVLMPLLLDLGKIIQTPAV